MAKNIIEKLSDVTEINILLQSVLEILCSLTNSEHGRAVFLRNNEFMVFKPRGAVTSHLDEKEKENYHKIIEKSKSVFFSKHEDRENAIYYPYTKENSSIIIEMWNKKEETLTYYCTYSKEDETTIEEMAKVMFKVLVNENPETILKLRQLIRSQISNLNNHSLLSTIRCAAQKLLDCDRATLFIKEGKNLVVKAQGLEQEIPTEFNIPLGKGIVGYVAQTGQTENIRNVYSDSRFNSELDQLTGYKTTSMLCMPIFTIQGQVIAALQMINKNNGCFEQSDEETLELFCKTVSIQLQNWSTFQDSIEERTNLLNILNSIGNFVLVLNSDGCLSYYNRPFEDILGVNDEIALNNHYSL